MSVKKHFKNNQKIYFGIAIGVGIAGITWVIVRHNSMSSISHDVIVTAERDAIVQGKNSTLNTVSYFSSERQGPPSWVIRCLETNLVYTSQASAASEMGISTSNLSRHLNGLQDNAQGFTFERICMVAA